MKQIILPVNCPEKYIVRGELYSHIVKVLRYKKGTTLKGLDINNQRYDALINEISKDSCELTVKSINSYPMKSNICLFQSMPKGKKIDNIIRSATELGTSEITPIFTEFSCVKSVETQKIKRFQKIAVEALQQSGSEIYTKINTPIPFASLPEIGKGEIGIIFHQDASIQIKPDMFLRSEIKKINIIIGPEGGFSKKEIASIIEKGYISLLLGRNILRVETAAISAIGFINTLFSGKDN